MKRKLWTVIAITCAFSCMFSGCFIQKIFGKDKAKSETESESVVAEEEVEENEEIVENSHLAVNTIISYSAGSDSDWSYGNQRKEFPDNEKCYVRIASVLTTDKGKYKDQEVQVTYRFTGVRKCQVNISDGLVKEQDTNDYDVKEFTHFLYAAKEDAAAEDVVIFQYIPKGAEGMTLEVIYDDQVAERYDTRNAIYFTSDGDDLVPEIEEEENIEKEK